MNQAKMLGRMAVRCTYGCCRSSGPRERDRERRYLKRQERMQWKLTVLEETK